MQFWLFLFVKFISQKKRKIDRSEKRCRQISTFRATKCLFIARTLFFIVLSLVKMSHCSQTIVHHAIREDSWGRGGVIFKICLFRFEEFAKCGEEMICGCIVWVSFSNGLMNWFPRPCVLKIDPKTIILKILSHSTGFRWTNSVNTFSADYAMKKFKFLISFQDQYMPNFRPRQIPVRCTMLLIKQ